MAEKIFIADKATQDAIKTKTDLIGVPNPTTGSTATVMNYLKQLEGKFDSKFDESKVTPFNKIGIKSGIACNITGKGFISNAFLAAAGSGYFGLKIVLDGTTVFESYISDATNITGVVSPSMLYYVPNASHYQLPTPIGNKTLPFLTGSLKEYPYIYNPGYNPDGAVIVDTPLYFKNSLRIEVSVTAPQIGWTIMGGLY